jgi:hypothetical protein
MSGWAIPNEHGVVAPPPLLCKGGQPLIEIEYSKKIYIIQKKNGFFKKYIVFL